MSRGLAKARTLRVAVSLFVTESRRSRAGQQHAQSYDDLRLRYQHLPPSVLQQLFRKLLSEAQGPGSTAGTSSLLGYGACGAVTKTQANNLWQPCNQSDGGQGECLCAGSTSIFGVQPSSSTLLRASCDAYKLKPLGAAIHQRQLSSSRAAFKPQLARHRARLCRQVRPDTVCLGPTPHCLASGRCCWYPSCAGEVASALHRRILSLSDMIAPAF